MRCHASTLFVGDGGTGVLAAFHGSTLAGTDNAGGALGFPTGIAIGPDGNVYVADQANGAIDRFNGTTGAFIGQFVSSNLFAPSGIAFAGNGNLYVADFGTGGNSFIDVFDGTGALVTQLVAPGGDGLDDPNGIAFGPDGLYVANPTTGIEVIDPSTGALISVLAPVGNGPGLPGLSNPSGLTIGADGNLYVADVTNSAVYAFNATNGTFLGEFGQTSVLDQPIDLAFGPDGNLYVTDGLGVELFNGATGASMGTFVQANSSTISNPQYLAFAAPEPFSILVVTLGAAILMLFRRRLSRV